MEIDPHTVQQIVTKVREQLKCPQCRKRVDVTFDSLKVLGDDFAVLQLKCCVCEALIMLHTTFATSAVSSASDGIRLTDVSEVGALSAKSSISLRNASSKLAFDKADLDSLNNSLQTAEGSFMKLFSENK